MAEKEGLVRLGLIASDQPTAAPSPVAFAPSVEQVLIPCSGYAGYCVGLRPMAEKEGFEPPVPFQVQLISSQSHSATLPLLLKNGARKSSLRILASLDAKSSAGRRK